MALNLDLEKNLGVVTFQIVLSHSEVRTVQLSKRFPSLNFLRVNSSSNASLASAELETGLKFVQMY